jgi:hypothetical protein
MQPGSPSASIVHLIQFLIVTVDLHWSDLDFQSRMRINQSVLELLDCDDPAVLNWAFIFFGSLAHCVRTFFFQTFEVLLANHLV